MNKVSNTELSDNLTMSRQQRLQRVAQSDTVWDLIVVGGGIVGAGILKRACQAGLNVLLLEQKDFAWGSSSRSSKMVHGGLRYIAEGQIKLTKESVLEREKLLQEAPLLVTKQSFAMTHYQKQFPQPWIFNALLSVYDSIAKLGDSDKQHKFFQQPDYQMLAPGVKSSGLLGGTQFYDALTDDARMVQRLIQESLQLGAQAINYCPVTRLVTDGDRVTGVYVQPEDGEQELELQAKNVVNATGAWTNSILQNTSVQGANSKPLPTLNMRPLRGSHLVFANWRLPVASVISVRHPQDQRPVQIYPWLNATVVGTTDVEHKDGLSQEAKISREEFDYLMETIDNQFPAAKITKEDVISTWAGIRPVVSSGSGLDPSKEKREHSLNHTPGLITVAGGKLTTFDVIAKEVIALVAPAAQKAIAQQAVFAAIPDSNNSHLPLYVTQQALACYGELGLEFLQQAQSSELTTIAYSKHLWAELGWAAKYEQVQHLDDLLLRRTRLGNLLPQGGAEYMAKIKTHCKDALDWSEQKWQREINRYLDIWQTYYGLPSV